MNTPAALGFRVHSGWAAMVVLTGPPASPSLLERKRVMLIDRSSDGAAQPYHTAAELDLPEAEQRVAANVNVAIHDGCNRARAAQRHISFEKHRTHHVAGLDLTVGYRAIQVDRDTGAEQVAALVKGVAMTFLG